jgi:hypothetical protein
MLTLRVSPHAAAVLSAIPSCPAAILFAAARARRCCEPGPRCADRAPAGNRRRVVRAEHDLRRRERADRDREQQCGRSDQPAGALESDRDRRRVGGSGVSRLLDPREQQDPVIGRQAEPDREQEDRLGRVERALASVGEEPLQVSVLEDQHQMPNTALRLSAFISTALTGSTTEPVIKNRMIIVEPTTTASTAGRWLARLCSKSTCAAV